MLLSGYGNLGHVIRAVEIRLCRVGVAAADNVSTALQDEAGVLFSGRRIPNPLLMVSGEVGGAPGSREGDICCAYPQDFRFLLYFETIQPDPWLMGTGRTESSCRPFILRDGNLPRNSRPEDLPSNRHVFEFQLAHDAGATAAPKRLVPSP